MQLLLCSTHSCVNILIFFTIAVTASSSCQCRPWENVDRLDHGLVRASSFEQPTIPKCPSSIIPSTTACIRPDPGLLPRTASAFSQHAKFRRTSAASSRGSKQPLLGGGRADGRSAWWTRWSIGRAEPKSGSSALVAVGGIM